LARHWSADKQQYLPRLRLPVVEICTFPKSSRFVSKSHVSCHVFVDFDGTIVPSDATDMLFGRFCDPEWLKVEADWKAGRIGSRECMSRQVDLLRATPEEFDELVRGVDVDPFFPTFVELCRQRNVGVTVVSDGLDPTITSVLARNRLDLPYFANHLEWRGGNRWRLGFPNARSECVMLSGNCKCQFPEAEGSTVQIMIGDGRSDFCVSSRVDIVMAKGALALHCRQENLPHFPVRGFQDVCELFSSWLQAGRWPVNPEMQHLEGATK